MSNLINKYRLEHARKRKQGWVYRGKGLWSRELTTDQLDTFKVKSEECTKSKRHLKLIIN